MASLDRHLIRRDEGLALLFTPPFDKTPRDPGYIKGYPPGLRENGGQYSHAAMWAILAFAKSGERDKAHELFAMLNPINHARTPEEVERYKVEPYVVAADVYSVAPHAGRGGWTWYTGSAAWMYRAGLEGILGIRREGDMLIVDPCIPSDWPGFEAAIKVQATSFDIRVDNAPPGNGRLVWQAVLDGEPMRSSSAGAPRMRLDGLHHTLDLRRL
jgi:cyclic beta-1,2-glucan synthetase